jgi:hypothetical protein
VLIASDRKNVDWNVSMQSRLDLLGASLAETDRAFDRAGALATRGAARLQSMPRIADEDRYIVAGLSLIAGDSASRSGRRDEALTAWRRASAMIAGSTDKTAMKLAILYGAHRRLGRTTEAQATAALLDQRGFRHPFYIAERKR